MSALRKLITMGGAAVVQSIQASNFLLVGNQEEKGQKTKAWEDTPKAGQQKLLACVTWDELVEVLHPSGLKWGDSYTIALPALPAAGPSLPVHASK